MSLSWGQYKDEWKRFEDRISNLKNALREVLSEVECADHWLRHTDAVDKAQRVMAVEDKTERRAPHPGETEERRENVNG